MADSAPALLYVTNHSTQHCNTAAAFLTQNPVDQQLGGGKFSWWVICRPYTAAAIFWHSRWHCLVWDSLTGRWWCWQLAGPRPSGSSERVPYIKPAFWKLLHKKGPMLKHCSRHSLHHADTLLVNANHMVRLNERNNAIGRTGYY